MEVVGQHDLGGRGFNADVWAHEGFAYIGHWGFTDWAQGSKTHVLELRLLGRLGLARWPGHRGRHLRVRVMLFTRS
jgi:hypothetical protein